MQERGHALEELQQPFSHEGAATRKTAAAPHLLHAAAETKWQQRAADP